MTVYSQVTLEGQAERAESEGWKWDGTMATEGELLDFIFGLLRALKPDVCVETGTFSGKGTIAISEALQANGRGQLWTVEYDKDLEYPETPRTTFVQADSREWSRDKAPIRIDFALVDCCEEPEGRIEVFKNLLPKMAPGGVICAHDVCFYAPPYLEGLIEAAEADPNILLPALNGLALWIR